MLKQREPKREIKGREKNEGGRGGKWSVGQAKNIEKEIEREGGGKRGRYENTEIKGLEKGE